MERLTLGQAERRIEDDHLARYQFAARYVRDKVVLDIACGTGYGSDILAREAQKVVGVDYDYDAIMCAREDYMKPVFHWGGVAKLFDDDKFYDVVVCLETIEHLDDYDVDLFLRQLWRVMKDDAILIISTPNRWVVSPWTLKPSNKFHHREYTISDLIWKLTQYGFKTEAVRWQRYIPSYLVWQPIRLLYTTILKLLGKKANIYKDGDGDAFDIGFPIEGYTPRYFICIAKKVLL